MSLLDEATRLYQNWRMDELPNNLKRNSLRHYYLSVWPSLSELPLADTGRLPARPTQTEYAYFHLPFCSGLCSFCSYYVQVLGQDSDEVMARYCESLLSQIDFHASETDLRLNYLYFGGGTPSLLPLQTLRSLLEGLENRRVLQSNLWGTF